MKRVLMLAAENGSIPRAKIGGMADVIRDLPAALVKQDVIADVIMPSYGFLAGSVNATKLAEFSVIFNDSRRSVSLLSIPHPEVEGAVIYFIDTQEGEINGTPQEVYSQGCGERPFAEDANKFALFCLCVATALKEQVLPMPDLVHLHDWHSAMFALLIKFDANFKKLMTIPCVYTIHNLAIQGIRPLRDDPSSLSAWFPGLLGQLSAEQLESIIDPRYPQCINPMRVGINLSTKVHLVSLTYADEVLKPSDHDAGFFGGEGLELDLQRKQDSGALVGILNACVYDGVAVQDGTWPGLLNLMESTLLRWQGNKQWVATSDLIALTRIAGLWRRDFLSKDTRGSKLKSAGKLAIHKQKAPSMLVTSVGRLTDQKVFILRQSVLLANGQRVSALESVLLALAQAHPTGLFIMLGSGDADISREFSAIAARYANFIFLDGYDESVAKALYLSGDLFMMPSSFEPCGISQMLAMKAGQICLVHGVGGLRDTVADNETGYQFFGDSLAVQAESLLVRFSDILEEYNSDKWQNMRALASQQRFDWASSALKYRRDLYGFA